MTKIVEQFRRSAHVATHLAVLLLLTGVALMHVALSGPADAASGGSPAGTVHMADMVQSAALSNAAAGGEREVVANGPSTLPVPDDDHHHAVVACCLLALSGISSLVVQRRGKCLSRTSPAPLMRHAARDITMFIEGSRPPDQRRFALGIIRA